MVKDIDKETEKKIQELQILEQNLQAVLLQKQAFQIELNETENALAELKKTKEDVYKVIGQVMIKSNKQELEKELVQKKDLITLRLKNLEKNEKILSEKAEKLRQEVVNKLS